MNNQETKAQNLLRGQWDTVKEQFKRIGLTIVANDDFYRVFVLVDPSRKRQGQVGFEVKPVVFNVPEKKSFGDRNLFIVARGLLYLDQESLARDVLKTVGFATEVGYFRRTGGSVEHVYGTHYDLSIDELGHPIFHAQIKSYSTKYAAIVQEALGPDVPCVDHVGRVLENVRMPTAQMDFFALILQICADHFLNRHANAEAKDTFRELLDASRSIQGVDFPWSRTAKQDCMRAGHWYTAADGAILTPTIS